MSRRAWVYIWSALLAGAGLSAYSTTGVEQSKPDLLTFVVLVGLAIFAQLFEAEAPGRQSFYFHTVFFFAGVLLLHPFLFVLLIIIPHLVEWAKERLVNGPHLRAWYIQPFNIAVHIIAGFGAHYTYQFVEAQIGPSITLAPVIAATSAVLPGRTTAAARPANRPVQSVS